jgi:hypothetical protein
VTAGSAAAPTVSSVLVQVQQAISANTTLLNTVLQNAKSAPADLPSSFETQVIGGQIVFHQSIETTVNSFPAEVSAANETNPLLIATLQNLLANLQAVNTTISDIDTSDNLVQPISLTGLNVLLLFNDALILTNTSSAARVPEKSCLMRSGPV